MLRSQFFIPILVICIFISGCIRNKIDYGYVIDEKKLQKVKVNETSSTEVMAILGSPSAKSMVDKKWYYITSTLSESTVAPTKVKKNSIITLTFNDSGIVNNIKRTKQDKIRNISFTKEKTPAQGNNINLIEEFLRNLGKYNASEDADR